MKLATLATVLRSKNASPFVTTCDIFLKDQGVYEKVKQSRVINRELISKLYKIPPGQVLTIQYLDVVRGIKISFLKNVPAGDPGCTDTFGAQQHAPLLNIDIP